MSFSTAIQRSSTILIDQSSLIKRVPLQKEIFPFYIVISSIITEIVTLFAFIVILFFMKFKIGVCLLALLFILPLQLFFTYGICLCVSSLHVFFRDVGIFLGTILQVWFFCTPIVYPKSLIPSTFRSLFELNPMFHLVNIYREIVLHNSMPTVKNIGYFAVVSIVVFLLGNYVFIKLKSKIVDYL